MASIYPIQPGRANDLLVQTRLTAQLREDQTALLRAQEQLSTGRRLIVPSDDASAALRAISFQRLQEQGEQLKANVTSNQSFLNATDNTIGNTTDILNDIRGVVLESINATSTETSRNAAAQQIRRAIETISSFGNRQFRDRYLFTGAQTTRVPFEHVDQFVQYSGDEGDLRSFIDLTLLGRSNATGSDLFGAISERQDNSAARLTPLLDESTALTDLHFGEGVTPGSVRVSDGFTAKIIDLSSARTLKDVADLIEADPPDGRQIRVRVLNAGLRVDIDADGGGELSIEEVNGGNIARQLGIHLRDGSGNGTGALVGDALNPSLRRTTTLADIFGFTSQGILETFGFNNNIEFTARGQGAQYSDVHVQLVDDELLRAGPGLERGQEVATYSLNGTPARAALTFTGRNNNIQVVANQPGRDFNNVQFEIVNAGGLGNNATVQFDPESRRYLIGVDQSGFTDIQTVVNAINDEGTFIAIPDTSDPDDGTYVPGGTVYPADAGVVFGNTGNSGGDSKTIFVRIAPGETTANDVMTAIQNNTTITDLFDVKHEAKDALTARQTGIGLVDVNAYVLLTGGSGTDLDQESGVLVRNGGKEYIISIDHAGTLEDVLNAFNGSPAGLFAEINEAGDGIYVRSRISGSDFSIGENGGTTATDLGIRTLTEATRLDDLNYGRGLHLAEGTDFTIRRPDGRILEIDVADSITIADLFERINTHPDNTGRHQVIARLSSYDNGIEIIDKEASSFSNIQVTKAELSEAAIELGLVPEGETVSPNDRLFLPQRARLDFSFLAPHEQNTAFWIIAADSGEEFNNIEVVFDQIDATGDEAFVTYDSVSRVLRFDIDPTATTTTTLVSAIRDEGTFSAALDLSSPAGNDGSGIIAASGTAGLTSGGISFGYRGTDPNPQEVKSVFNALVRLEEAILNNDIPAITRGAELLDTAQDNIVFHRAEIGARVQGLNAMADRLAGEDIELQTAISDEIDVDFVQAVTEVTQRQAAMEASLQLIGRTFQLSLLDYL